MTKQALDNPVIVIEPKEAFIRRLDGSFEKYESIVKMREDVAKLQSVVNGLQDSGLRFETLLILMQHHTKLPKKTIVAVLNGLVEIPEKYFKEETK